MITKKTKKSLITGLLVIDKLENNDIKKNIKKFIRQKAYTVDDWDTWRSSVWIKNLGNID